MDEQFSIAFDVSSMITVVKSEMHCVRLHCTGHKVTRETHLQNVKRRLLCYVL